MTPHLISSHLGPTPDRPPQDKSLSSMTNTMSLIGHQGAVNALEFHSGTLYSGGADDSVRVWNVLTGQCTISIKLKAPMGVCTPYTRVFCVLTSCVPS